VLRQLAVVTAIEDINGEADNKPDGKPQPEYPQKVRREPFCCVRSENGDKRDLVLGALELNGSLHV
jgi:hypothetical protein